VKFTREILGWLRSGNWGWGFDYTLHLIYLLPVAIRAKTIVELGTGRGTSLTALAAACEVTGGKIITVDIEKCEKVREKFKNCPYVVFVQEDSVSFAKKYSGDPVDFLLCDSNHRRKHVLNELHYWSKHLSSRGVIAVHDTQRPNPENPSEFILNDPYYACLEFSREKGYKFIHIPIKYGLGVLVK